MLHDHLPLTLIDPRWYDVAWAPGSPLLRSQFALADADPGWSTRVDGPWAVHEPIGVEVAAAGWKVHVSALPADAADVVDEVGRQCRRARVAYKHLRSRDLVHAGQLKYADPRSSGKVVTCYPSAAQLEPLCATLADVLGNRPAPAIVGEIQVGTSPIWLRHGAFTGRQRLSDDGRVHQLKTLDGRLVADQRGARGSVAEPEFVSAMRRMHTSVASTIDVSEVSLLHRSNAGGVYRATWRGRSVVLKEARRHAGLDLSSGDACERLRHEATVLRRLQGSRVAPEVLDLLELPEAEFLVMEDLGRPAIMSRLSTLHPAINPALDAAAARAYLDWRSLVGARLADLVATLAAHGVVHGDLQPANLIDLDDRLVAIDFESASLDGRRVARGVAAPGFGYEIQGDRLDDASALPAIAAILGDPTAATVLPMRPDAAALVTAASDAALTALARGERRPLQRGSGPSRRALVVGLAAAATPNRHDRLFPGGLEQFSRPGAALGVCHGAAGVLSAIAATGFDVDPAHLDWLEQSCARISAPVRGLADGLDGVVLTLARLGRLDAAARLWSQAERAGRFADGLGLAAGLAAHAVVSGALGRLLDDGGLRARAERLTDAIVQATAAGDWTPSAEGLFTGWGGVGLALLGLGRPDAARVALQHGAAELRDIGGNVFAASGRTLYPYLGRGGAGLGLLAHELGDAAQRGPELVEAVAETCRTLNVYDAGLLNGRAGLLLTLRTLVGDADPWVGEHLGRLGWHCLPSLGTSEGLDVLGRHGLRASTDLATGAAGVLLAVSPTPWPALSRVLGFRP